VHGDVDAAVEQRVVDLLGEQPLPADVRQGLPQDLVARGLDDADLEGAVLGETGQCSAQGLRVARRKQHARRWETEGLAIAGDVAGGDRAP
jgi:hypothetical protein